MVLSNVTGTTSDATSIPSGCTYLDWAVANFSTVAISSPFLVTLRVDGVPIKKWQVSTMPPQSYLPVKDFQFPLAIGNHTLTIKIDSEADVAEQNEDDNEFSKSVSVLATSSLGSLTSRPAAAHDFGQLPSGRTATKVFTFANSGPGGLELTDAAINGPDAAAFTISANTCAGKYLPPTCSAWPCASSCALTVRFAPQQTAALHATLAVADATHTVQHQVALSGAAVPGAADFNSDGRISLADAILLLQVVTGRTGQQALRTQADVTEDAKAGLNDAIYILQLLAVQRQPQLYDLVQIKTTFGTMLIWLFDETPLHRDNILTLARSGYYNGLIFHRVINDFMIQGGDPLGTGNGGPGYTLCQEITPQLSHNFGAVAAARADDTVNPEKNSSGSQFYIVENNAGSHFLDMNYTVFGQVISGLEVITQIGAQPTTGTGNTTVPDDRPLSNIVMEKVEVVTYAAEQLRLKFGFTVPNQ